MAPWAEAMVAPVPVSDALFHGSMCPLLYAPFGFRTLSVHRCSSREDCIAPRSELPVTCVIPAQVVPAPIL